MLYRIAILETDNFQTVYVTLDWLQFYYKDVISWCILTFICIFKFYFYCTIVVWKWLLNEYVMLSQSFLYLSQWLNRKTFTARTVPNGYQHRQGSKPVWSYLTCWLDIHMILLATVVWPSQFCSSLWSPQSLSPSQNHCSLMQRPLPPGHGT